MTAALFKTRCPRILVQPNVPTPLAPLLRARSRFVHLSSKRQVFPQFPALVSVIPSHANMSSREQNLLGLSSRRFACDRCRASKAKCLRQRLGQVRCDRCSRINSDCVTTPVLQIRSWQPRDAPKDTVEASRASNKPRKRQRRGVCPDQFPTPTDPDVLLDALHENVSQGPSPVNAMTPHQGPNLPDMSLSRDDLDAQIGKMLNNRIENPFDPNLQQDFFRSMTPAMTGVDSTASFCSLYTPAIDFQAQH